MEKGNNLGQQRMNTCILIAFLLVIALVSMHSVSAQFSSSSYSRSYIQNSQSGFVDRAVFSPSFTREMCQEGQDFILQVSPLGCSPSVVRSDLLESQNVPVFCPVVGTQINPLISVDAIKRISFSGDVPSEVSGVGFHPAQAALGRFRGEIDLGSPPILDNLGYAVIVLRQQRNESAMPDFVEGNLTARITYDIRNAFGVGQASFYLPVMDNSEWDRNFRQYGFWQGRGYLRAENVGEDRATISIYSDRETNSRARTTSKRKVTTENILVGESSRPIPMPGFDYCIGTMEINLGGIESPETTAILKINGDSFEVREDQRFFDNNCRIRNLEKQGVVQSAEVVCNVDEGNNRLNLVVNPRVNISIEDSVVKASVGDRLYGDGEKTVFLAYVSTREDSLNENDLVAGFVAIPEINKESLTDSEIRQYTNFFGRATPGGEADFINQIGEIDSLVDVFTVFGSRFSSIAENIYRWTFDGVNFQMVTFSDSVDFRGNTITLDGFADAVDADLSELDSNDRRNYESALRDYKDVLDSFASEKYPQTDLEPSLGEKALRGMIELQETAGQMRSVVELCSEFEDTYHDSFEGIPNICKDDVKLSNSKSSSGTVSINGRIVGISLDRIKEPTFEEFGAEILVNPPEGNQRPYELRKDEIVVLDDETGAFIQLLDIDRSSSGEDAIRIRTNLREGTLESAGRVIVGSETRTTIRRSSPQSRQGYLISLQDVNLQEVAHVSIIPSIHYQETQAEFPFRIGIEKRSDLFKLSPEKTRERIDSLNDTLETWENINDNLENIVEVGNKACLVTGAAMTVKGLIESLSGEGIARRMIMRGEGGWFEICGQAVNSGSEINGKGPWNDVDSCLLDNNREIENSVNEISEVLREHNQEMEDLRSGITTSRFLGEDIVDNDAFMERLVNEDYRKELEGNLGDFSIEVDGKQVSSAEVVERINTETTYVSQARDLQLNARLLNSEDPVVRSVAEDELRSSLIDVYLNSRESVERNTVSSQTGFSNPIFISTQDVTNVPITQRVTFEEIKSAGYSGADISDTEYVQVLVDKSNGDNYLTVLNDDGNVVNRTYLIGGGNSLVLNEDVNPLGVSFDYYDRETYDNECTNCELRYYETGQYSGLPAIVPFPAPPSLGEGWYAATKSNLPMGGSLSAYDDSGRVSSFYLCNVGRNGRQEFFSGLGDDDCVGLNPSTNQPYNQFPGLSDNEASQLATRAVKAIAEASRRHSPGLREVELFGRRIKVGEPSVGIPDVQCQDFMSPNDCNFVFNICDPFVCPSSRCDLGGKYPVSDVVQSGIVGSVALCAPNFPEVVVPICVSGVYASSQGYENILSDYQSCLEHSLETGQQIGICDQLHSVYMCDFVWRQGLPLANAVIPSALGEILGKKSTRGGGEYLTFREAWQDAADSANFFIQEYAVNSANAFQARSLEGVGTEVCRNWLYAAGPDAGNLFDSLARPRVPPQFNGWFDDIEFTTSTVPPTSQYNVFFNIYSGEDFPVYYQVYLRNTGGSFFQDTSSRRIVASGFIPTGETANCGDNPNQPCTFTAPTGFNEMCIVVNDQEECGFGRVSTDFGLNYINDEYIADQISNTDIRSERECVSGTPNILTSNLNIQSSAENLIDPSLQDRGIVRICSTENPGSATDSAAGTENSRWVRVGHCGEQKLGCWLDTESSRDVIRHTGIEEQAVGEAREDYLEALRNETNLLSSSEFRIIAEELIKMDIGGESPLERIGIVNENIERVFLSYERGFLILIRGNAYSEIVKKALEELLEDDSVGDPEGEGDAGEERIGPEDESMEFDGEYPILQFNDGRVLYSGQNIYYTFLNDKWYWSLDGEHPNDGGEWIEARGISEYVKRVDGNEAIDVQGLVGEYSLKTGLEIDLDPRTDFATPFLRLNEENIEWTTNLSEANYLEGLEVLIYRVRLNEERSFGVGRLRRNSQLSTENIQVSHEGIFSVQKYLPFPTVYFEWNVGWYWYLDEDEGYVSVEEDVPGEVIIQPAIRGLPTGAPGGSPQERSVPRELSGLIESLRGKNRAEGAAIIFSIDTENPLRVSEDPMDQLPKGPVLPEPTLQQRINNDEILDRIKLYEGIINQASERYGVHSSLIKAVIIQESVANPDAEGDDGVSLGLMQVSDIAARDVSEVYGDNDHEVLYIKYSQDPFDPNTNIKLGTAYIRRLIDYYESRENSGDNLIKISVASYNYGVTNIRDACLDQKWENCENIPSSVLQYVSNIISYRDELMNKIPPSSPGQVIEGGVQGD